MSVQSLRIVRLFLWGILAVALLTVGTMYLLRVSILAKADKPPAVVKEDVRPLKPLGQAPEFTLSGHGGKPFRSQSLKGMVYVVDFFFTGCKGICPILQANMKKLQVAFDGNPNLRLLSISVDPKADSVERLASEAKKLGANPAVWTWTVGPTKETGRIAKGYMLIGTEVPGEILHSNRFVLVDGYGKIRGFYTGTEDEDVQAIQEDIRRLLGE